MPVVEITSLKQFREIIESDTPSIIDFWATWCGPCVMISPIFAKFSDQPEFEGVNFYKVDVDAQEQISQEVGVRAMPTFILFKNGNKVRDLVGANPSGLQSLVEVGKTLL